MLSLDWFRLWLSPVFEDAACTNAPVGIHPDSWARQWTSPETPAETRAAMERCLTECPALTECRVLVSLGSVPRGVVQAGHAYGLRVGAAPKRVASTATPPTKDEDAC